MRIDKFLVARFLRAEQQCGRTDRCQRAQAISRCLRQLLGERYREGFRPDSFSRLEQSRFERYRREGFLFTALQAERPLAIDRRRYRKTNDLQPPLLSGVSLRDQRTRTGRDREGYQERQLVRLRHFRQRGWRHHPAEAGWQPGAHFSYCACRKSSLSIQGRADRWWWHPYASQILG